MKETEFRSRDDRKMPMRIWAASTAESWKYCAFKKDADHTAFKRTEYTRTDRVQELVEALRFYADEDTYDANAGLDKRCENGVRPDVHLADPIKNDKGAKARKALEQWDLHSAKESV